MSAKLAIDFQSSDLTLPDERFGVAACKIGIYFLRSAETVVYVGQSVDIFSRVRQHRQNGVPFDAFSYRECSRDMLDEYETAYTALLKPARNLTIYGRPRFKPMCGTARRVSIDGIPTSDLFGIAANDNRPEKRTTTSTPRPTKATTGDKGTLIPSHLWTPKIAETVARLRTEYAGSGVEVVVGRPPQPEGDNLLVGGDVWGYAEWPDGECIFNVVQPRYKSVDSSGRVGRAYYLESAVKRFYGVA